MPVQLIAKIQQKNDGTFKLVDIADLDTGDLDVVMSIIAGGGVIAGVDDMAPEGEIAVQRKTTTGAPDHTATEATLCWNSVDEILYASQGGGTWAPVGGGMGANWRDTHVLDPRDFGAAGDGTTDDSAAFADMRDAIEASLQADVAGTLNGHDVTTVEVYVSPGQYLITEPDVLIPDPVTRSRGLRITGGGHDATQIVFAPTDPDVALWTNDDKWLHVTFSDITFVSTEDTATWCHSISTGGAQLYSFDRVYWRGTWKRGLYLTGTNNNSEFSFFNCGVHGSYDEAWFDCGSGVAGEDQFLNYWFHDSTFEWEAGDLIRFTKGGHVHFINGSVIMTTAAGGTFVKLLGGSHFDAVNSLTMRNLRHEPQRFGQTDGGDDWTTAYRILYSEWNVGQISIADSDESSAVNLGGDPDQVLYHFAPENAEAMPVVQFTNCRLTGSHLYEDRGSSSQYARRIEYDSCVIEQHAEVSDFALTQVVSGQTDNAGSRTPIRFTNCRSRSGGSSGRQYPFDTVLNWDRASNAIPEVRTITMQGSTGALPLASGTVILKLPYPSLVTGVRLFMPGSAVTGLTSGVTSWLYTLTSGDGTTLATLGGGGLNALKDGFNYALNQGDPYLPFWADSDNARTLTLTANADVAQSHTSAFCLVEYVA